jgi:hypothetical protein
MPPYVVNVVGGGTLPTLEVSDVAADIKNSFALDAINNTSDQSKPASTALTSALSSFVDNSAVGEALNNPPVLEFNFTEDQYVTKNPAVADGTLINGKTGPAAEFSRPSGATYKDHLGMLRYAPENLLPYSSTFTDTNWSLNRATVTASAATDPFGMPNSAALLTETTDGTARAHYIREASGVFTPVIGQTYCMSVYVKAHAGGTGITPGRYLQLKFLNNLGNNAHQNFDIQEKITTVGANGSAIVNAGIQTLQNGWLRIWATTIAPSNAVADSGGMQLWFVSSLTAVSTESYIVSSNPHAIYIYGMQVERSLYPQAYLNTTSSAVYGPRFHYDSLANKSLGLIFEAQKTNYAHVNSGTINESNCTVTRNYGSITAPDGSYTSTQVQSTPTQNSIISYLTYDAVPDAQYTRSFFVKALSTRATVVITANENPQEGVFLAFNLINKTFTPIRNNGTYALNYGYEDYGNGWIRVWVSMLKNATHELNGRIWLGWWGSPGGDSDIQNNILFWGPQLEDGYVMTSYIPNSASQSLIRSADTCAITGANFSNFYNAAAGTLCVNYRSIQYGPRYNALISVSDGTNDNRIYIGTSSGNYTSSMTDTEFTFASGTLQFNVNTNTAAGVLRKTAFAYSNNTCAAYINGVDALTAATNTPTNLTVKTTPIVDRMTIGGASEIMNISAVRYHKQRLSNATLQTLTSL